MADYRLVQNPFYIFYIIPSIFLPTLLATTSSWSFYGRSIDKSSRVDATQRSKETGYRVQNNNSWSAERSSTIRKTCHLTHLSLIGLSLHQYLFFIFRARKLFHLRTLYPRRKCPGLLLIFLFLR